MSEESRNAVSAAFDLHATENTDGELEAKTDTTPSGEGGDEGDAGQSQQLPSGESTELSEEPGADGSPSPAQRARDAAGKFTKSDSDRKSLPADGQKPAKDPLAPDLTDPALKGPQSWKPEARAEFGKLSKPVREEIQRREKEMDTAFRQTAEMRNYATSIHKTLQPYDAMIRAEGGNHQTAVDSLLKSAYILRQGDPQTKTSMVAQMIVKHGIDITMLDDALQALVSGQGGQQQRGGPDPMLKHFQQELAPIKQFIGQLQGRQQEVQTQSAQAMEQELTTFANDPANQYFGDVSDIMADILDAGAKRGVKITLQDAYRRATLAHPEISSLVTRQQVSASAAQRTAAARRAQHASASLPSGGAPAGAAENLGPVDRRSALEAAWEQSESRGS